MRWLRFAQQYIDTGIKPASGYRIETTIRMKYQADTMALFGSRNTAGSADRSSFNAFLIFDFGSDPDWIAREYFRMDYAKAGAKKFDTNNSMDRLAPKVYELVLGSTSSVNGDTEAGGTFSSNSRNIFIGTINNGGSPDTRWAKVDFNSFKIYDNNNVLLFDGTPVNKGSTEYKGTPAPSNCFYDTVSGNYFTNAGSNFIGYEDDEIADTNVTVSNKLDYGIKMLSDGDNQYEFMNGKYQLFGADLSAKGSQFKTYEITLTGYDSDPVISWPAYQLDWNFYTGSGTKKKLQTTIDTGLDPKTIKSIFTVFDHSYTDANYKIRGHQYLVGNGSYNTYIEPTSITGPSYMTMNSTTLAFRQGMYSELAVISGQGGIAHFNTLGEFNGGALSTFYFEIPQVYFKLKSDGKLEISTSIPYNWIQRAGTSGTGYYARWYDWAWIQGITLRVTILSTPYIL